MVWVDGKSDIHIYDGSVVDVITSAFLPVGHYPILVGEWTNRLFLAYEGGRIFFSVVGDPTDFDGTNGAGEILMGSDVTDFIVTPAGDLLVTMKDRIDVITDLTTESTSFAFRKDTFSPVSGAITHTVKRMLGTIYYADDRGLTNLEQTEAYGDFQASSIAQKVERTYQNRKQDTSFAITNREDNQYILFFNGSNQTDGLVFSFKDKYLKGATKISLNHIVRCVAEGKNEFRKDETYFGSDDGYVYKMFTGTSFDGKPILTRLATSFYHYGSPTNWKSFREILFEFVGDVNTFIKFRPDFEYAESYMPTPDEVTEQITQSGGGVWGAGVWGVFKWAGNVVNRLKAKILGYGTVMRVLISTEQQYEEPHTFHNMTVQYRLGSTKH
jgi:hypothetical protein